jgi:hypothetical protein
MGRRCWDTGRVPIFGNHTDPNSTPPQAGMVLALEPAAYVPGVGSVHSAHVILVTAGPAAVRSAFTHDFRARQSAKRRAPLRPARAGRIRADRPGRGRR